jgi:hypothetical protein
MEIYQIFKSSLIIHLKVSHDRHNLPVISDMVLCQFLLMILQIFCMFSLVPPVKVVLHAQNCHPEFPHSRIKKNTQMSVFCPWYCHLKAVLSISYIFYAVFPSLKQNLTQMHFSFKSKLRRLRITLHVNSNEQLFRSNAEGYGCRTC